MPYLTGYTPFPPTPTLRAGVPNHKTTVEMVNAQKPHLLRHNTAASCGEFLQHLVKALPANERWGLLSKSEGEGGYTFPNGVRCSYDYVTVQQGDRIDVIASAAGHDLGIVGGPSWVPALESEWRPSNRYVDIAGWPIFDSHTPTDAGADTSCAIGFGWFCLQTALAEWPDEAKQNLDWIMKEINPDCFRVMLCVEGESHGHPDCWRDAGVFITEDWENRYKKMLDVVGSLGKTVHATVYGGRNQTPTEDDRRRFHDRIIAASEGRWEAIRSFECMNEFRVNKWEPSEVRAAGRDLRAKLPPHFLLSLSSPDAAHGGMGAMPTNEQMQESFDELYGGSDHAGANEITIHTMRDGGKWSDPFSFNVYYPHLNKINNEPPGPGSSAGGMHTTGADVYKDGTKTVQAGWALYMGHSEWSVWNGHLPREYHNGWREVTFAKDLPNMPQCAVSLAALVSGTDPVKPPVVTPPPAAGKGTLRSGESLLVDQSLHAPGGTCDLRYQNDGNLVCYVNGTPHWMSGTMGESCGSLQMQPDGNLVLYSATTPIRATRTAGHPGAMLQLQDDGNMVVYEDPTGPLAGTPIWASATDEFYATEE